MYVVLKNLDVSAKSQIDLQKHVICKFFKKPLVFR